MDFVIDLIISNSVLKKSSQDLYNIKVERAGTQTSCGGFKKSENVNSVEFDALDFTNKMGIQ